MLMKWWLKMRDREQRHVDETEKLRGRIRQLEEEVKLRDLQIKNLVAENTRNFERVKAETAAFSATIVRHTEG